MDEEIIKIIVGIILSVAAGFLWFNGYEASVIAALTYWIISIAVRQKSK